MSEDGPSLVTFATAGFLIASILIFGLVALPELMPTVYPQLRFGTIAIQATSTSGALIGLLISGMEVTVTSIAVHRVGIGGGAWITVLNEPQSLNLTEIAETPATLVEAKISIGDYNLLRLTFGGVTAVVRGANVTLSSPTQDFRVSTTFTISEEKRTSLSVDISFNEAAAVVSQRFDPYLTVTVEQPGHAVLSTIASLKPLASLEGILGPGKSKSSTFTIDSGSEIQRYLVHTEGGRGAENTFDLEIGQTGGAWYWYELTGSLWFLGGNLTAGTYNMTVLASDVAVTDVGFRVNLYLVPRITSDLPDAAFSGSVPAGAIQSTQINEFAVYLDNPGLYDFYLGAQSGDYEFLVDNNPAAVVSKNEVVTLQLDAGLHTFQVFADFSGSRRDTNWNVGVAPVSESNRPLSREATLATALLVIAIIVFVVDVTVRRLQRRKLESRVAEIMEKPERHDTEFV